MFGAFGRFARSNYTYPTNCRFCHLLQVEGWRKVMVFVTDSRNAIHRNILTTCKKTANMLGMADKSPPATDGVPGEKVKILFWS